MILKLLGLLDIFIAICLGLFACFGFPSAGFILALGIILLVKGAVFSANPNFASTLDIICALVVLASYTAELPGVLTSVVVIYLLQKGLFSMIGSE